MNSDITQLMESANVWEHAGYVAAFVVIVGIFFESFELCHHVRGGRLKEKILEILGAAIIIIGLVGELLTTAVSNNRTGDVIGLLNEQAASAQERAAVATKQAADLGVTVDNLTQIAQQKAAQANLAIASINDTLSHIQRANTERVFTDETKAKQFVAMLREFSGSKYGVLADSPNGDRTTEQARLAEQLRGMLQAAGWTQSPATSLLQMFTSNMNRGLIIGYLGSNSISENTAQKLQKDFALFDIQATLQPYTNIDADSISFEVGMR
jgi:hypothetical protein